jgi:hypothetical protein
MQKEEINCGMLYEVDEKIIQKICPNVWSKTIRYRLLNELTSTQTVKNKRLCIGGFYSVLYQYFYIATV